MKGIILAGGKGSRMLPLSRSLSKHLLPVYSKPMIYYPLSTLMLSGVRDVLLISSERDLRAFQMLLGDGKDFGLQITYGVQNEPRGIADAVILGEGFLKEEPFCLVLGDNLFYGSGVGDALGQHSPTRGATVFTQQVTNPSDYGVLELDSNGKVTGIREKPTLPPSNLAVTGLYFFDSSAVSRVGALTPSARGELEITSLNESYLDDGMLQIVTLPRGTAWFDMGTIDNLAVASEFVRTVENRQGLLVSSPHEVAWRRGWLTDSELLRIADEMAGSSYGSRLGALLSQNARS